MEWKESGKSMCGETVRRREWKRSEEGRGEKKARVKSGRVKRTEAKS